MVTTTNSQAPDVLNSDGSVTRVVTQTIVFSAAEYAYQVSNLQEQVNNLQNQISAITQQSSAAQTLYTQQQSMLAANAAPMQTATPAPANN